MKNYIQQFPNEFYEVYINWCNPIKLSANWEHLSEINQEHTNLYRIIAKRGDKYKLLYIGMTEKQSIHQRLYNKDHQLKQQFMKESNKGYVLYVCIGKYIQKNEDFESFRWAKKNIKIIEKLLIVSHSEIKSLINKKNINWFSTGVWLTLVNQGFLKDDFIKSLSYGIFKR